MDGRPTKKIALASDEVLEALVALGEDPKASRVEQVRALTDSTSLPAGERADVVRRVVDEARTQVDRAPMAFRDVAPEPRTQVEIDTYGPDGLRVQPKARWFVGEWQQAWSWSKDGRAESHCRVIVDIANEKLTAAQVDHRGQWIAATEDQQRDLATSLFIEHKVSVDPKAYDFFELDRLPTWAAAVAGVEQLQAYRDGEALGLDRHGNAIEWSADADMPVESGLTREMIILAKRSAMGHFFFVPSAEDDDDGFDRFMSMRSSDDIAAASRDKNGWGHIFLADHWQGHQLANIQKWVFKDAARLIATMCGVSPNAAIEHLQKQRTTHAPNDNRTRIGDWDISLSSGDPASRARAEERPDTSTSSLDM
ncbi:hypothetical protein [Burkholderia arboris]|uniref:hypothetical protein n=1 Tax=Burkholderia arboris TaxID=488730 RepID=UPI001CF5A3B7|nr:hypothetical protein [Burkholderia arboris]MCA8050907.1 hypothetical protein [Burkholderia arboris]